MESYLFTKMEEVEETHWWFVGRRRLVEWALKRMGLAANAKIFEAGCGTGGNLALLEQYGQVMAMESDPTALAIANKKKCAAVVQHGSLPDQIPFSTTMFDLIMLLDVLEHIAEDRSTLENLRMRLAKDGQLLVTVPAFPFLWSYHDEAHHHFRRYTRVGLTKLLEQAGFSITFMSYFNTFLFPVVAGIRFFKKIVNYKGTDDIGTLPTLLNFMLARLMMLESYFMNCMPMPFGTSLMAIAKHNPAAHSSTK